MNDSTSMEKKVSQLKSFTAMQKTYNIFRQNCKCSLSPGTKCLPLDKCAKHNPVSLHQSRYVEVPFCMIKTWIVRMAAIGALANPFFHRFLPQLYTIFISRFLSIPNCLFLEKSQTYYFWGKNLATKHFWNQKKTISVTWNNFINNISYVRKKIATLHTYIKPFSNLKEHHWDEGYKEGETNVNLQPTTTINKYVK
jgi:hypothetical protein